MRRILVTSVLLVSGSAASLLAQSRETLYGIAGQDEYGGSIASTQACGSGTIVVGTAKLDPPQDAIHVVRTHTGGGLSWEARYRVAGQYLSSPSVVEASDGSGFYIAGRHHDADHSPSVFLMKIDCTGRTAFANTYAAPGSFVASEAIIEARTGDAQQGAMPGDVILAGTTGADQTFHIQGLILRISSSGALVFAHSYDYPDGSRNYTAFHALAEAGAAVGDIVAVGLQQETRVGWGQGFVVRVDAASGEVTRPDHCATVLGPVRETELFSVAELKNGPLAGDLVMGGIIQDSATTFLARTAANPCVARAQSRIGTAQELVATTGLREVPAGFARPAGSLALTGSAFLSGADTAAFLLFADPGPLMPTFGYQYGPQGTAPKAYASAMTIDDRITIVGGQGVTRHPNHPEQEIYRIDAGRDGQTGCARIWWPPARTETPQNTPVLLHVYKLSPTTQPLAVERTRLATGRAACR